MSSKVSRVLFRSLLRWNRRDEITKAKMFIEPRILSAEGYLPPNLVLKDSRDVQACIYHAFRNTVETPQAIDQGFKVLKGLNYYQHQVKKDWELRCLHSNDMMLKAATYRIGQLLQFKSTKMRGIVIGWKVDVARQTQQVELLFDSSDYSHHTLPNPHRFKQYIDSSELEPVQDPLLKRVDNENMKLYFVAYDPILDRFLANEQLLYIYPRDYDDRLAEMDNTPQPAAFDRAMFDKVDARIDEMMKEIRDLCQLAFPWKATKNPLSATAMDDSRSDREKTIDSVLQTVWELIDLVSNGKEEAMTMKPLFIQQLRRGNKQRQKMLAHQQAAESPVWRRFDEYLNGVKGYYNRLQTFTELIVYLEQCLWVRFQHESIAFRSCLVVHPATGNDGDSGGNGIGLLHKLPFHPSAQKLIDETKEPKLLFDAGSIVRHKKLQHRGVVAGYDRRPMFDVANRDGVIDLPSGGDQPFYRIVPDEKDMERNFDVRNFHFDYLAQESLEPVSDPREHIISDRNMSLYFRGYNAAKGCYNISTVMNWSFPRRSYRPKVSNYPIWINSAQSISGSSPVKIEKEEVEKEVDDDEEDEMVKNECKWFAEIDCFAVQLGNTLNKFMVDIRRSTIKKHSRKTSPSIAMEGGGNSSPEEVTADDLLLILKQAPNQETAQAVENFLYQVSKVHENINVRACMTLGILATQRGAYPKAIEAFELATAFDKNFAEGYSRQAASYVALGDHVACQAVAKKALKISPHHVGAMTSLAISYEKSNKKDKAVQSIRAALATNPWAQNLPTRLTTLLEN